MGCLGGGGKALFHQARPRQVPCLTRWSHLRWVDRKTWLTMLDHECSRWVKWLGRGGEVYMFYIKLESPFCVPPLLFHAALIINKMRRKNSKWGYLVNHTWCFDDWISFCLLTWLPDQKFQNQIRTCQLLRRDKLMNTLSLVSMSYPVPNIFALYLNHPDTWTKVLPCLKFVSWSVGHNFAVCILVWNTNWADLSNLVIYDVSCQWHGFCISLCFLDQLDSVKPEDVYKLQGV